MIFKAIPTVLPFVRIRVPALDSDVKIECLDSAQEIIFDAFALENNREDERIHNFIPRRLKVSR